MSNVKIQKGKILKGPEISVEYTEIKVDGHNANCTFSRKVEPHPDLAAAFKGLAIHAAFLGEFIPTKDVANLDSVDVKLIEPFTVTGFSNTGGEDNPGVMLYAQRRLSSGKRLGFNTPNIRFAEQGDSAYPFMDDLEAAIKKCEEEMQQFLNGKVAPDPQGQLALPE